ncbi:MAG: integrase core domain-containing protein [Methanosarcinaceae archaeon]|nr:integrase core domain-containing protein [Methanosarcinaceae archaeon]
MRKKRGCCPKQYSYEEKCFAIRKYLEENAEVEEISDLLGAASQTIYGWLKRVDYSVKNLEQLKRPEIRQERTDIKELTDEIKAMIDALLVEHPAMGPLKIKQYLFRHEQLLVSEKKIYLYLKEKGIIEKRKKERKELESHNNRFEYEKPLEAIQLDILHFKLAGGQTIYLITLLDDHSRFILKSQFAVETSMDITIHMVKKVIKDYGYIEKILCDKGSEFVSWKNFSLFEEFLCTLEIELVSSGPKMPFVQGKIERWHQTMRTEFESNSSGFTTLCEAQKALESYINYYNYERPHEGIGGLVPADRFFGVARDLQQELSRYKSGDMRDKRIYFCCNIEGQKLVVSGMRNDSLRVYTNEEGKKVAQVPDKE